MYDVIIIGAGPAGLTAGIYAANNKLKTLVLAKAIPAYPLMGNISLLTFENLKNEFEKELKADSGFLEFKPGLEVNSLEKNIVSFCAEVNTGATFYSKVVIIATGQNVESLEGNAGFDLLSFKDAAGKIKVDSSMASSVSGIFAAGGVIIGSVGDVFASAGEGAKAALSALGFLRKK